METNGHVGRIVLVPRGYGGRDGRVRRYGLARVAPTPRSATGVDRHERLERVVEAEEGPPQPPPSSS